MKKNAFIAFVMLGIASLAAYAVGFSNPIINTSPGLAYSKRYVIDLQNAAINTVSATAVFSSGTYSVGSFTTGQVSTGSYLVVDNTILSTASATNNITVASTSGVVGDSIVVTQLNKPGAYVLLAGRDWNYKTTTALTAASIKVALDKIPYFTTSRSGAVLYSTATTYGANPNAILVQTNNTGTLTIAHANFTGGRDATVLTVNGYPFKAGVNFTVGATAALTATAITNAINAKTGLSSQVTATVATSSVTIASDKAGTIWNVPLLTSNSSSVSVLHPTMVGGTTPSWTLGSKNITITAHGFVTALPVLLSAVDTSKIPSGLTSQTTYYAIPVDANTIQLASSSNNAVAGTGIVLASSSTLTAAKTVSLTPLAWVTGSAGFAWQVSDDNSSWSNVDITSITWTGNGSQAWNFGQISQRYLGLNITKPTSGAMLLSVTATGTYTP